MQQAIHPDDALLNELFGSPIHIYTRTQAIADGVLWDLSADFPKLCREHYKYPIACTATVAEIINKAVSAGRGDHQGIIHDMLWMSRTYKRTVDESTIIFRVKIAGAGRKSIFDFKMVCGPDDTGAPCMTIMLPSED